MKADKVDRYEQILAKYDWQSTRPPRGYQYGVGRGAKAFVTTAELTVASNLPRPTAEESDFFHALDRLEERVASRKKRAEELRQHVDPSVDKRETREGGPSGQVGGGGGSSSSASGPVKLTIDDLATVDAVSVSATLVPRNARSDEAEKAEEYVFADERVLTAHDVLRGRSMATQQSLESLLAMGSPDEQTTWITHSRVYREMNMAKRAEQTLIEGCARTGSKGSMIWEERLSYIPESNPAARRQLLEEATTACPSAETLWVELLKYEPPHTQLNWLQRAVIACPSSEQLWLRVVQQAPTPADQKKIIRSALQRSPALPLLWSKLACLEPYEKGREVFRAAARQFPSFNLVVEAAKYVEWSAWQRVRAAGKALTVATVNETLQVMDTDLSALLRTAQENYLEVGEEASRQRWLQKAEAVVTEEGYTWTAAYMYVFFVRPKRAAADAAVVSSTWMEDLEAFIPNVQEKHAVLCALWGAWLLLVLGSSPNVQATPASGSAPQDSRQKAKHRDALSLTDALVRAVRGAVLTAPQNTLFHSLDGLVADATATEGTHSRSTGSPPTAARVAKEEEEEEEELGPVAAAKPPSASTAVSSAQPMGPSELPTALTVVLSRTITTPALAQQPSLALLLAKAFFARSLPRVALYVLQQADAANPGRVARLQVAIAKVLAAEGKDDEADACLVKAIATATTTPVATSGALEQEDEEEGDVVWVKLAVHRRSKQQDITELLNEGLRRFPRSPRLWLMRLEAARAAVEAAQGAQCTPPPANATKELRVMYEQALSSAHCRSCVPVWVFAALRIESELFSSGATARALLLDAMVACVNEGASTTTAAGGGGGNGAAGPLRFVLPASSSSSTASTAANSAIGATPALRRAAATVALGVARAKVELQHTGPAAALEVVKEVLQHLPKTREGLFTVPVGELLEMYIDLEVPSARGRAAAQVMKQWRSREPLALLAVSKLYHVAGNKEQALEQAIKAVQAGEGRCGDAIALLWKLALLPEYATVVARKLATATGEEAETTATTANGHTPLPEESVRRWVWSVAVASQPTEAAWVTSQNLLPNTGPLWIDVAKARDASNVTLLGYRDSVEDMLRRVMEQTVLK